MFRNFTKFFVFLSAFAALVLSPPSEAKTRVGEKFPEFKLKNISEGGQVGSPTNLSKHTLYVFFVTDGHHWRDALAELNDLSVEADKSDTRIVVVIEDDNVKPVKEFIKSARLKYLFLNDAEHKLADLLNIEKLPAAFYVDSDGLIKVIRQGLRRGDAEKLLRDGAGSPSKKKRR